MTYVANSYIRKILLEILHSPNFYNLPTDPTSFYECLKSQHDLMEHLSKLDQSQGYENKKIVHHLKTKSLTTTWNVDVLLTVILNVSVKLQKSLRKALEIFSVFKTYCLDKNDFKQNFELIENFLNQLKDEIGFKDSKIGEILKEICKVKHAGIIIEDVSDHQLLSPFVLPKLGNMFENLLQTVDNNSIKKRVLWDVIQELSINGNNTSIC